MFAKLISVRPCLDDHDDFYEFDVDVEFCGKVHTVTNLPAGQLLDQHEFAVVIAESLGCLMGRESDWRKVLAESWQAPLKALECADASCEEEMILADEKLAISDQSNRLIDLLFSESTKHSQLYESELRSP